MSPAEQDRGPATRPPGSRGQLRRGVWPWRDFPSIVWLILVAGVSTVHHRFPESGWLMVHMVLLGALTHAAMVWSTHFAQALLKNRPDLDPRPVQSARLALLFGGVSLVLGGVWFGRLPVAIAGAIGVVVAVGWHGIQLWRRLRGSLAARFRVTIYYYLVAAACVPIGATYGVLLANAPAEEMHGRFLVAHTTAMALGWIGLTVTGTLVTLWPTMLRTKMDDRAERLAQQALPIMGLAVATVITAATLGSRPAVVAGLVAYLSGLAWWGRALLRPARARSPREMATLSVLAALTWGLVALCWIVATVALRDGWPGVAATYGVPAAMLAAGFGAQLLVGALSYLIPSVIGGGPAAVRAAGRWVDRWAIVRLTVANGAMVLSLLPVPSIVRVITTGIVLVSLLSFIPLLALAIRDSVRVRREPTATQGMTPHRANVWSSGQYASGLLVLALAVAGGVLVDPAGARVRTGASEGSVVATGHTTSVRVVAQGMRFTPNTIEVPTGDRLVIELVNEDPSTTHDLVFANGTGTRRLDPGATDRLDVGLIGGTLDGWCSVVGHRQMGMVFTVTSSGGGTLVQNPDHQMAQGDSSGSTPTVDLHGTPGSAYQTVDPALPPAGPGRVHKVTFTVEEVSLEVAPGVWQKRWTFNGAVPGPTLRGKVGDVFEVTLVNHGSMGHSIDFHAGALAPDAVMRTIPPGASLVYRFTAQRSGIWMYHCSTMPMSAHIAAGMHGAVIIDPPGLPAVDREYLLVQSEVYLGANHGSRDGASEVDFGKVRAERPDAVVFNGIASQYDHRPLTAKVGERVRIWLLDAGPNRPTSFHTVGGQFDTTYAEGRYLLRAAPGEPDAPGGSQVLGLLAAQGGFVELTFPEPGHYPIVSHIMVDAERGAHGIVEVTN